MTVKPIINNPCVWCDLKKDISTLKECEKCYYFHGYSPQMDGLHCTFKEPEGWTPTHDLKKVGKNDG